MKYVPGHKKHKQVGRCCESYYLLKPSYILPREQCELRGLTRYQTKQIQDIYSNKNCVIRILGDSNEKLSSMLSDIWGIKVTKLINKLCFGNEVTLDYIEEVYHKKIEVTTEEFFAARHVKKRAIVAMVHSIIKLVYHVFI